MTKKILKGNSVSIQPERIVFYLFFVAIMACVFLEYAFQISVPEVIVATFGAIIAFFGKRDEILALIACTLPLYLVVPYLHILLICMAVYVVKFGDEIRVRLGLFIVFFILVWELIHCLDGSFEIRKYLFFCLPYIVCLFFLYSDIKEVNYAFVVRILAVCTLLMGVFILYGGFREAGHNLEHMFNNMIRLGMEDDSETVKVFFNPNTLGYFCILAAMGPIQLLLIGKGRVFDLTMITGLVFVGAFTLSRTYFVCLAAMVMLFLFSQIGKGKNIIKYAFGILLAFCALGLLLQKVFPAVIENLLFRFQDDDLSGGRMELFKLYNNIIFSSARNTLYGVGLLDFRAELDAIRGTINASVPHNGFQEVVVAWGMPGLVLFVVYVFVIVGRSKVVNPDRNLLNCIPLLLLLLKVQAGQMITSYYTMMMYPFAYLSLIQNFKTDKTGTVKLEVIRR